MLRDLCAKTAKRQQDTGLEPQRAIPAENTGLGVIIYCCFHEKTRGECREAF